MGKSKHSLGFRLLLALAIPTLYCLCASLAGVGASRRSLDTAPSASPDSTAGSLSELAFGSAARARLRADLFGSSRRRLLQVGENETELVLEALLLSRENCTPPSINEFPSDGLSREQRQGGYILIHVLIAVYSFLLLAIICDDFFVPSISKICERISVTKDVAGATFMAVASSSPELFINIVGTFVTEGDLGVGTIVGSAVFNILAVPACCGLFAAQALDLEWWPVSRDSVAYGITVLLLIVTLRDGRIEWYEAFILVFTYILYILAMCFNTRISTHMNLLVSKRRRRKYRRLSEKTPLIGRDKFPDTLVSSKSIKSCDSLFAPVKPGDKLYQDGNCNTIVQIESLESSEEMDIVNMTSWPDSGLDRCWWILTWPINLALLITIPDCRRPGMKNWYPLTFLMCIVWIALMSYIVGWDITIIGDTLQIPDSVMGLTFLAAGMSVPEAVSSVIVTNKGDGTMGISNSIGSNVFDVLLCLGLPWLVKSTLFPTVKGEHFVQINSEGLIYSSVSLMSTLVLLYATLALNRFRLDRKVGLICLAMYSVFLVFASLVELNVFFVVNRPTCIE